VVLVDDEVGAAKSFRNLARVSVLSAASAGVADLIGVATLVVSDAALAELTERATRTQRGAAEAVA
jgi:large subunit ribosomal protein L4